MTKLKQRLLNLWLRVKIAFNSNIKWHLPKTGAEFIVVNNKKIPVNKIEKNVHDYLGMHGLAEVRVAGTELKPGFENFGPPPIVKYYPLNYYNGIWRQEPNVIEIDFNLLPDA